MRIAGARPSRTGKGRRAVAPAAPRRPPTMPAAGPERPHAGHSMTPVPVFHRTLDLDGVEVFYREAGPADAPVVLLPHGYPCSSFEFRALMAALGDRWRC